MKVKNYSCLLLITFLLLPLSNSCKNSVKNIERAFLKDAFSKIKLDGTLKWLVILPGLGCDGCIQEGEVFMKRYIENRNVLFVLTNISSLKILEQKIGVNIKEHQNVYIDRENIFYLPTDNSIYPCIIRIENNKILSHEFQCPKNGQAFNKLKNLILEH
jgi:hypothetical protein